MSDVQAAVGCELGDAESGPPLPRELLPGDEARVVLEPRDEDLVPRSDLRSPPRGDDQVQRLRRAAGEDEALGIGDAEVAGNRPPRVLVSLRGASRESVRSAVRVG